MPTPFKRSLRFVLEREGGYVNHPDDPGGHTNRGITLATYTDWRRKRGLPAPTVNDLRAIDDQTVEDIYRDGYWEAVRADELPEPVAFLVFDMAVNAGPSRAIKLLQEALGVTADGIIGPQTMAAVEGADVDELVQEYSVRRLLYYATRPHMPTFGTGWFRRAVAGLVSAVHLVPTGPDLSPSLAAPTPHDIEDAKEREGDTPPAVPIAIAVVGAAILGALVLVLR